MTLENHTTLDCPLLSKNNESDESQNSWKNYTFISSSDNFS